MALRPCLSRRITEPRLGVRASRARRKVVSPYRARLPKAVTGRGDLKIASPSVRAVDPDDLPSPLKGSLPVAALKQDCPISADEATASKKEAVGSLYVGLRPHHATNVSVAMRFVARSMTACTVGAI